MTKIRGDLNATVNDFYYFLSVFKVSQFFLEFMKLEAFGHSALNLVFSIYF